MLYIRQRLHQLGFPQFLMLFSIRNSSEYMQLEMAPRWKGKAAKEKAQSEPMSNTILQLQSSLTQTETRGLLKGSNVILAVEAEQVDLLTRACFGRPIVTADKDKQWFQLGPEEAFYLCHHLKCLKIVGEKGHEFEDFELWQRLKSEKARFCWHYKAYSHLRMKNWVVRPGSQYGVDFVVYRHHPSLVHSEYAVLVLAEEDDAVNGRLRVWSDFDCTVRLCGSVAKTLLVLNISENGACDDVSLSCLQRYSVTEQVIERWNPEQNREDQSSLRTKT